MTRPRSAALCKLALAFHRGGAATCRSVQYTVSMSHGVTWGHMGNPMKRILPISFAALLLWTPSCASGPTVESGSFSCRHAYDGDFIGFFSLEHGELTVPLADVAQVDLVYYFDADDCSRGALMGNDDKPGYIFPVGNKTWDELVRLQPPASDARSVAAIAPLTKDKEGLAFWLRTASGQHVLVRIVAVREASISDLTSGTIPSVKLEWMLQPT
jgi:hypothetical protein